MTVWLRRLGIAIPCLWVTAAHVGPLIAMARISLLATYPGPPDAPATVSPAAYSLAAYRSVLDGPGYPASLLHSLCLAAVTTIVSLLLAYPLAYHVARRVAPARRGRRLLLLVAPFWAGEVVRMFALALLLANRGATNALLRWAGLWDTPVQLLYGSGAVTAGMIYTVLPAMLLPLYAALNRLPKPVLEAASDLGASAWQRFWHVTLPLTLRGVVSGATLTFLASLGILAAPALLGGSGTPVFASTIAGAFSGASGRWPLGSALGFVLLLAGTASAALLALPLRLRQNAA